MVKTCINIYPGKSIINKAIIFILFVLLSAFIVNATVSPDRLMYYYEMEACANDFVVDTAGVYNVDLTDAGVTDIMAGVVGRACNFDNSDHLNTSGFVNASAVRTIDFWFNRTQNDTGWLFMLQNGTWGKYQYGFQMPGGSPPTAYCYDNGVGMGQVGQQTTNGSMLGVWEHWLFIIDDDDMRVYKDCNLVFENTTSTVNILDDKNIGFSIGSRYDDLDNEEIGGIYDNFAIWDTVFSAEDITWACTSGKNYSEIILPTNSSSLDLLFTNTTDLDIYKTTFDEGENYWTYWNWTDDSTNLSINSTTGICDLSIEKGIMEYEAFTMNLSFCDNAGCNVSQYYHNLTGLSTVNVVKDFLIIEVCHPNIATEDLTINNITCDGSINVTQIVIDNNYIPSCNGDPGSFLIDLGTNCTTAENITYFVEQDTINYNKRHIIKHLEFDREYDPAIDLNSTGDIFYNWTTGLWRSEHDHEHYEHGLYENTVNCSHFIDNNFNNTASENITIVNVAPFISFTAIETELNQTILENNTVMEYINGTWSFLISVLDDDLDTTLINFSALDGTAIFNQTTFIGQTITEINFSSLEFVNISDNLFFINVYANDTAGDFSVDSVLFNVTDTVDPSCDFPVGGYAILNSTNLTFNVNCVDENFFSMNLTCPANNYSNYTSGLNVTSWQLLDSFQVIANDTCSYKYCDGHTGTLKKEWDVQVLESDFEFNPVNKLKTSLDGAELSYDIQHDRVTFDIVIPQNQLSPRYDFVYTTSPDSYHFSSEKYKGWIVDAGTSTWFDMNGIDGDVQVSRLNSTAWSVSVIDNVQEVLRFESIGELNCIEGNFSILVTFPFVPDDSDFVLNPINSSSFINKVPRNMQELGFLIIFIIMCTLLTVLAAYDKSRYWWFISGFAWFLLGFILMSYSWPLGLIIVGSAIVLILSKIMDSN